MKQLLLLIFLIPFIGLGQVQIGQNIYGENQFDFFGYDINISSNGNIIAISGPQNSGNGSSSGHVRIFENIGGVWIQIGQDIDGEGSDDYSGESISMSSNGNIVAIGSRFNGNNSIGHVRIFKNIGGVWTQIGQDIDGENEGDSSGTSVSLSSDGNIIAIGSPLNSENIISSGHVRIFENIGGVWTQIGQDIDGENDGDYSGTSVSLSSDGLIVAIGGPGNDEVSPDAGQVRVFENIGGVWTQIGQDINGSSILEISGANISLSSNGMILAIGAPRLSNGSLYRNGAARVYKLINNTWTQLGDTIYGDTTNLNFSQGLDISSDGTVLLIGGPDGGESSPTTGQARVYKYNGNTWNQVGLTLYGLPSHQFGNSVSLSSNGTNIAVASFTGGSNPLGGYVQIFSIASELAILEVVEDIAGNSNGINVTAAQLNSINGVSSAIDGVNYSTALDNGTFVDENNPTALEIQTIIDQVNATLGVTDNYSLSFKLYPNPTKAQFTIQLDKTTELKNVNIYNNLGQLILTCKKATVNSSKLASGLYVVEIETNKGKGSKKLIIE
ncbi:hypothetical protein FBALC1_17197 [Flavobacteriales bacterium ALC-1]|nr:hypothetical protein FBALC1_00050 [Flavobacteriales bacterium ALC-1]EDP72859.1 hypothetical protein FBALC1_17197 [Flavobacteriales bacterium ALC-1]